MGHDPSCERQPPAKTAKSLKKIRNRVSNGLINFGFYQDKKIFSNLQAKSKLHSQFEKDDFSSSNSQVQTAEAD